MPKHAHEHASAPRARDLLTRRFGHVKFQPGQWDPMEALLDGRDAVVVMPTGSGKSLIYQLPALLLPGLTVVVSPLIALMKDQQDKLSAVGVDAMAVHSHLSGPATREMHRQIEDGEGAVRTERSKLDGPLTGIRLNQLDGSVHVFHRYRRRRSRHFQETSFAFRPLIFTICSRHNCKLVPE